MPRGRVAIVPKAGYYYETDNGTIMYVIRITADPKFPVMARDPEQNVHLYTAKGRYFYGFGNHDLHFKREVPNQSEPHEPVDADKPGPRERSRRNIGKIAVARALKPPPPRAK